MSDSPIVQIENASKIFGTGETTVYALRDLSLEIKRGEFAVILGPSGCGKTTLLNLIGGLDTPTKGKVIVDGTDIETYDDVRLTEYRRLTIGFVFQFFNLVQTLTAEENVQLAAELVPNPRSPQDVLESVGLGKRGSHFPAELSGGEQQRVAIARALVKNPAILLCDEPTGELDAETGQRVLTALHNVHTNEGRTVIVVTHNSMIAEIGDLVLHMRSGQIDSLRRNPNPKEPGDLQW